MELAASSRDFYRQLVYETPEFVDYFRQATPIDLIEHIRLGRAPAAPTGEPATFATCAPFPGSLPGRNPATSFPPGMVSVILWGVFWKRTHPMAFTFTPDVRALALFPL